MGVVWAAVSFCALSVIAADGTWTGAVDGAWSNAANWQGGTVASGAGFVAALDNLAGPIQITNDVAGLKLKGLVAKGGAYTLKGQPLTLEGAASGNFGLVVSNGTHAVGATVNLASNMQVYVASGASLTTAGLLDFLGGTTLTKKGAGEWVFAGTCAETNDNIRLDVIGGTLRVAAGAVLTRRGGDREGLRVGYSDAAGRVVVESGASLNVAGFVLGHGESVNATGYLLVDGGTLTADTTSASNPILVGRRATGTLCASNNATVVIANWFDLGVFKRGELHIGGNSTMTAGRFSLGWHTQEVVDFAGPGVVTLGSGLLSVANQFVWRSSGVSSRTNLVTVGNGTAGSATLRLPATMRTTSPNGSARLTLDGGTLEMIGVRDTGFGASLTNYLYGLEQFWIGRAGATFDTTNNDVTVTQVIARDPAVRFDGGVTKRGTGRLTLAGGGTYEGPTVIQQGALRLRGALPTGAMVVAPGAALSLADGQYRAFAPHALTVGQSGESVIELEVGAAGVCDSLTLPADAAVGTVRFALVSQTGAAAMPAGDYVIATYSGADPEVGGWSVAALQGVSATFEVQPAQKRVVLHVAGAQTGNSVWIAPGSGAWTDAANWNTAPANAPATQVLFGNALGVAATVSLGSAATVGSMTFDAPFTYTLSGSGLTFGTSGTPGSIAVQQGAHVFRSAVSLPADLTVTALPGASVQFDGAVTGSGSVRVTGGGAVAVTNNALSGVPLILDGGVLSLPETATIDTAFSLGAAGGTVTPAAGKTATLTGAVSGAGALTKDGASVAVMSGANSGTGARTVKNGMLTLSSLTDGGDLVIGEGTLKYVGPDVVTGKGFTIRTSDAKLGAAFESDADVTFNGNITTDNGVFVKAGKGTVTFAAPGVNTLGVGVGSDNYQVVAARSAFGESPTQGLRIFQVHNGKVVMGVPGQTNVMNQTIIIGGESTLAANAETAGHLEINGGVLQCGFVTIGRGNGSAVTAPAGLVSTVRINGGVVQSGGGVYLAAKMNDMATVTARPLFEMNDGVFSGPQLLCGNAAAPIRPRLVFNGGFAAFTGSGADDIHLAYAGGCTSETVVAGGTLAISNTVIKVSNSSAALGVLRLNGGRLITRGIQRQNSGVAELYLNGGVLQACQNMTLTNLSSAIVQTGGCVADVPAGLTLTVMQTLAHDAALGGTPDGGFVKLGAGTLVLGFNHTYTGPTLVSGGVLRVSGTLAVTNLTVAGGATLSLADGANRSFTPSAFVAGDASGNARIELEVAANGSANDVLALPADFSGALTLRLLKTGTTALFVNPGLYPLLTFSGAAPATTGWTVEGLGAAATFETEGSVIYVRIGSSSAAPAVWANAAGGAWGTAGNWTTPPSDDASAGVLFGTAISSPATITTGGGVTFGYLAVDSANAYTWSGGAMTLGAAESNATVRVAQGSHAADADWAVPSAASLIVDSGAALSVNGAVTGAGSLSVTGGGTLALTNGPACGVPLSLDGVILRSTLDTVYDTPFTLGAGGAVFTAATGRLVTVASDIAGSGGLTKSGSSLLTLSGNTDFAGALTVRNGTLAMASEPGAALVIGEGTFKYAGPNATFARGYTVRTTTATQAATLDADADITFNGQVKADLGAFIKWGGGTLTYAYAGENTLSAGDNIAYGSTALIRPPYGDSPSQGYRSYTIFNGRVVLGADGQTNRFSQAVVIGGQSTLSAGAETAGHLEINGGVNLSPDYITVGRGNGSAVTAPAGLESTLTVNGGESAFSGFWMAAMMTNMTTLTARPLFTMNGGTLSTPVFYCGSLGGTPKPQIVINGGTLTVGPNDAMKLANSPGCQTEMTVNGGTVFLTNQVLSLAENFAGAQGVLNLNGGRLVAMNLYQNGTSGVGIVHFNGGVFQPSATRTLNTLALTNRLGGAVFDVPADVVYTVSQTISHDAELGASPDGGVHKLGAGTLVLGGAQAYTGPTVVSNGTLSVTGTLPTAAELVAATEGRLILAAPAAASLAVGRLSLGSASGAEAALTLTADRASFALGGALSVSGDLFLGKTAVSLLARETGAAPSTNGTYTVFTCAGAISGSASELRLANGVLGKAYAFTVVGSEVLLTVSTAAPESGAVVWNQTSGGAWSEPGNWVTPPGAGAAGMTVAFLDAVTAPATVTLDDEATAGAVLFDNANGYTLAGGGSLALDATNGAATVTVQQGAHTVAVDASLDDAATLTAATGTELWMTGEVSGEGALTKEGAGRLLLSGTNTYSGGTVVKAGTVDVVGGASFGSGPVTFDGGAIAGKGSVPVTVPNAVTALKDTYIGAYAPLVLSGDWTATGNVLFTKVSSNELTVAGTFKPATGSAARLEPREGAVRFAAGADALFTSTTVRESIDFRAAASTSVSRSLTVESGANVSARCLYVGFGASNRIAVTGGSLALTGYVGSPYSDALIMGAAGAASPRVWDRLEVTGGSVTAADGFWCLMGVDKGLTTLDVSGGTVSLGQISMGNRDLPDQNTLSPSSDVFVRGGVLEARQRWNWIGDRYGARLNAVYLDGGRLRLPATFASVSNRLNQTRLVFNGGVLETTGGGQDAENPANYLSGLKQAFVGAGGAVVDTQGRSVTLAQRLTALGGATDGGVTKRGMGTLTLAAPPCVTGRIDVQSGALRLQPESGLAYPDDPAFRLSVERGITNDDSPYAKHAGLTKDNTNNLALIAGPSGTNALAFNGLNGLYVNYSDDMQGMDTYTVSAWVRQAAYQTVNNQAKSFFGTLAYGGAAHDGVLRIENGAFRFLTTGQNNVPYGQLLMEVTNALPLNTWTMLTLVVNGTNGVSMYVNGARRTMRVTENSGGLWTLYTEYGSGKRWYFQPPSRTSGRAFVVGTTGVTDDTLFFKGDLDDVTVYFRALADPEIALLHQAKVPFGKRARVATGAQLDLAGAVQAFSEVTGEGSLGNGTAQVKETLNPGDSPSSPAGALLTVTGSLTLGTNMTYTCNWTPGANDLVDIWGTLRAEGAGTVDLGLTTPDQIPGSPRRKSFPIMYYTDIVGAANFTQWKVKGVGRTVTSANVSAANGVVTVTLDVPSGTLILMR
jgi:autotransporter-associated beta strand protein